MITSTKISHEVSFYDKDITTLKKVLTYAQHRIEPQHTNSGLSKCASTEEKEIIRIWCEMLSEK